MLSVEVIDLQLSIPAHYPDFFIKDQEGTF